MIFYSAVLLFLLHNKPNFWNIIYKSTFIHIFNLTLSDSNFGSTNSQHHTANWSNKYKIANRKPYTSVDVRDCEGHLVICVVCVLCCDRHQLTKFSAIRCGCVMGRSLLTV